MLISFFSKFGDYHFNYSYLFSIPGRLVGYFFAWESENKKLSVCLI